MTRTRAGTQAGTQAGAQAGTQAGAQAHSRPQGPGLRTRLARTLGLTAALSVAATALITFALVRQYAEAQALAQLTHQADAAAADTISLESTGKAPEPALTAALRELLNGSGDRVAYVATDGRVLGRNSSAVAVAKAIDLGPVLAGQTLQGTVHVSQGGEFVYVAEPVPGRRARGVAGVVLARSVGLAATVWKPLIGRILLAGALVVLVAVGVSFWIARRLADPLRRVSEATRLVAAGDLSQRVPVEGDGEVAEVARQFNGMAEALSEARRREHEFLANVSHEVRTPLTAIRGYTEALADGSAAGPAGQAEAIKVIGDEAARLELLLRDVIDLARLGAREFSLDLREVSLGPTLQQAVAAHAAKAAEVGVTLMDTSAPALATQRIVTDSLRVRQIVSNLVDNALRVTPRGGAIRIGGHPDPATAGVILEVGDTGPGIAAADLPHVFERSYLWGKSQNARQVGTGLGLAIVRELALALGGHIDVRSELGAGTVFALHLPLRPPGSWAPGPMLQGP